MTTALSIPDPTPMGLRQSDRLDEDTLVEVIDTVCLPLFTIGARQRS